MKLSTSNLLIPDNGKLTFRETPFPFVFTHLRLMGGNQITVEGALELLGNAKIENAIVKTLSNISVPANRFLEILPGSRLEFGNSTGLVVQGTLRAHGSLNSLINLTGIESSTPWNGITASLSFATISLSYCNISNASTAIDVRGSTTLTVDHANFSNCSIGINVVPGADDEPAPMHITNNTFTNFPLYCTGIAMSSFSNAVIAGNVLTGPGIKGTGIHLDGSSPQLLSNAIESFKYGISCVNGSSPLLENGDRGGYNIIARNVIGVLSDASEPNLGTLWYPEDEGGQNKICLNGVDVSAHQSTVYAQNDSWAFDEDPPGIFEAPDGSPIEYTPWLPPDPNCGGFKSFAEGNGNTGDEGGMTPVSPIMKQIMRERKRGNYAAADALIRAAIRNPMVPDDVKLWALGQLLAVGQRMRGANLSAFVNSLTSQPTFARKARMVLPMSYLHQGMSAQAMAAYDANIQQYPHSNLARSGLYGKFIYHLYTRHDTTQARSLLDQLQVDYPQSVETQLALLQFSNFHVNSVSARGEASGGLNKLPQASHSQLPPEYALQQNHPNPFNPTTTIRYQLPQDGHVVLKVYDILGREVATVVNEVKQPGEYSVIFDGTNLPSGVYFYRLTAGGFTRVRKMILVR